MRETMYNLTHIISTIFKVLKYQCSTYTMSYYIHYFWSPKVSMLNLCHEKFSYKRASLVYFDIVDQISDLLCMWQYVKQQLKYNSAASIV